MPTPQADPVADYLRTVKTTDAVRAQAWDAVHSATSDDDLTNRLQRLPVLNDVKAQLFDLKPHVTPAKSEPARDSWRQTATDVAIGAGKGAINTISGLGDMARKIPGVAQLDRLMTPAQVNTTPTNTAQRVGYGGEQIGEFFIPVMGTGGRVAKMVKAGGLTLAQTGSPTTAGVSAAITGVLPGASAVQRASSGLRQSAEKEIARALGATKEVMKDEAADLAPQMLRGVQSATGRTLVKGVSGSRQAMLDRAADKSSQLGATLHQAYADAAAEGQTVDGATIRGALHSAADVFHVPDAAGNAIPIPGTEQIIKQLGKLDQFVTKLGPDIPVDKAAHIKQTWDAIVDKAGLFGSPETSSAADKAVAKATKAASDSFRWLLNANPTIGDLNKELSFWLGLRKVLTATERRTQAQSSGLVQAGMGGAGAIIGAMTGDGASDKAEKAILGGLAGKQLIKVVQSPYFRTTVAGPLKDKLADALASGKTSNVLGALGKITAALPARMTGRIAVTTLGAGQ